MGAEKVSGGRGVSLVVAALQVFTLNVPAAVVRPRELDAVLVHTPADASFAAAGRLALPTTKQEMVLLETGNRTSTHSL